MINWKIEKRKLGELKKLLKNPRKITKEAKEKLRKKILELGDFKPILVVDSNYIILAGNQKYDILLEEYGKDFEVNISYPERELSEKERKKIIIIDNKHDGEDDWDILVNDYEDILNELQIDLPNYEVNPKEKEFETGDDLDTKNKCPKCGYEW